MKSLAKLVMVTLLTLVLLGSAAVAFAQEETDIAGHRQGLRGEVTAVGDSSLTVTPPNGENITVNVTGDTKIRLVETQNEGSLNDIEVGNFVGVRGQKNDDGSVNARLILVASENPRDWARVGGKVTAVNDNVITIENRQDNSQDIMTNDGTKFWKGKERASLGDIEVGDPIVAAGVKRDDGSFVARLVVVATREQLRQHTLRGEVLEVNLDEGTLSVQSKAQDRAWLVKTTDETKYRIPGVESPSLKDVNKGDHILVVGKRDDDNSNSGTAYAIAVIPEGRQDSVWVRGEITAVNHDEYTFVLHSERGDFTILTNDSTHYRTRGDHEVSYDDIKEGIKAIAIGTSVEGQDHTIEARLVGLQLASQDSN